MTASAGATSPSGVMAPPSLSSVADRVTARLAAILDAEQARWSALDDGLEAPITALRRMVLSGGKRLRPAFCYWSFIGAGGDPDDPLVLDAGAAFELLQVFALIHDDVMDGSATRRGTPTIHTEFAGLHRSAGWRGEARRFGEGVAIITGDVAHVYADRLMSRAPDAALALWHELRVELNVGQYLDIAHTARAATDLATARLISRYKSGKYTVERPLHVGAALMQRYEELEPLLSAYGAPLGEAFQLRDDLLGAFGEEALTGKPVGEDLREGKPTPLLAIAHERATASQRGILAGVGSVNLGPDEIAEIQAVIIDTGARAHSEQRIAQLTARAAEAISATDLDPAVVSALCEIASFVGSRRL